MVSATKAFTTEELDAIESGQRMRGQPGDIEGAQANVTVAEKRVTRLPGSSKNRSRNGSMIAYAP